MSTDHPHQEEMHTSPPKPDRQASLCSESENLAPTQSGSTTGSDDQIHPAATNSTIVASPDLSLAPPLKDHAFPVDVKRLGSEAESTTSLTPTGDGQTSPMAKREQPHQSKEFQKQKRLNIHWSTSDDDNQTSIYGYHPLAMILLFLGGMLGAIGHHLYNQRLSGRQVVSAAWPQRWGIALAFFIKMMLGAAVQIAFKQMAWLTVKKRAFRIRTLDSIFHVCYDPAEFFDKDLLRGAFMPVLLAGLLWLLPLSAIATPSTLTLGDGIRNYTGTCANVSHLEFSRENDNGENTNNAELDKNPLSFWLSFDNGTSYYDQPSMDLKRIFNLACLSTSPIQPDRNFTQDPVYVNPLQQDNPCPPNSDCIFTTTFSAPAYKCEEREEFGGQKKYQKSDLAPYGDLIYVTYSSVEEDERGRPLQPGWDTENPNNDTGVFVEEPTLWIGYSWYTNLTATAENATQWNTSYWSHQVRAHILECTLHQATYHVTQRFSSSFMEVVPGAYRVDYGPPLLEAGQEMRPNMSTYMEFAGFHATGILYRNLLSGNMSQPGDDPNNWASTFSDVSETDLLDPGSAFPHEEALAPYIEAGFQNVYIAMLSDKKQLSQYFEDTPCEISANVLVWDYNPMWLAISYCIAVGLTLVAVLVGLYAIAKNGYVAGTGFSAFLSTTRNGELDSVVRGSGLGALPLDKEVGETVLRFGESVRGWDATGNDAIPHASFGFPDQIRTIRRGKKYN